jgi:hypothetical protein
MANISSLGNQIFLNQNVSAIANKYVNAHARLTSQDVVNGDNFEENHKRLKDTRETEETEAIDENMIDSDVYTTTPRYPKRNRRDRDSSEERKDDRYLIDEKNKKIDIKI